MDEEDEVLGFIVYGISARQLEVAIKRAEDTSRAQLLMTLGILGLVAVFVTFFGMLVLRRTASRITEPLEVLSKTAAKIAAGDYEARVNIKSRDEVEQLGDAFNSMVSELADSHQSLADLNASLEHRVEERTAALASRNRDMRLVLDNVEQGLVTLGPDGVMSSERSAIVDKWFGAPDENSSFVDYASELDAGFGEWFTMSHEELREGIMPMSVLLDQMPQRFTVGERIFKVSYIPMNDEDELHAGLLLVIDDITAREALARQEAEQRELMRVFEGLSADRMGFISSMKEAALLVSAIKDETSGGLAGLKQDLHTLKGNSGFLGFEVVARMCHGLEEEIEQNGERPRPASFNTLFDRWGVLEEKVAELSGGTDAVIEVPRVEYTRLTGALTKAVHLDDALLSMVLSWDCEPMSRVFGRFASLAKSLATKLGKGDLGISIDDGDVRTDPEVWGALWSAYVHIVRNAVDHGLETTDERREAGKGTPPALAFRALFDADVLTIECRDNGRGIDWDKVRNRAAAKKLPHGSEAELVEALLSPDFSTKDEATMLSGRGIGMSAVRDIVRRAGGRLPCCRPPARERHGPSRYRQKGHSLSRSHRGPQIWSPASSRRPWPADSLLQLKWLKTFNGCLHPEVARVGVAFCVEDVQSVRPTRCDLQRVSDVIKVDVAFDGGMKSPKVEGETAVNKDPDVIVTPECETFPALIGEAGTEFGGEVEVVPTPLISKPKVVQREKRAVVVGKRP